MKNSKTPKKSRLSLNSKAQGHVEIMLSFVLFIGAIIFIFVFISPFKADKEILIEDNVQKIIMQNITKDIGMLSIVIGINPNNCYKFVESDYNGNYIEKWDSVLRTYTIYFSEEFTTFNPNYNPACGSEIPTPYEYTLASYSIEKVVFNKSIIELKNAYENDYNKLKQQLGIDYDFSFNFKLLDQTIIESLSISRTVFLGTLNLKRA